LRKNQFLDSWLNVYILCALTEMHELNCKARYGSRAKNANIVQVCVKNHHRTTIMNLGGEIGGIQKLSQEQCFMMASEIIKTDVTSQSMWQQ